MACPSGPVSKAHSALYPLGPQDPKTDKLALFTLLSTHALDKNRNLAWTKTTGVLDSHFQCKHKRLHKISLLSVHFSMVVVTFVMTCLCFSNVVVASTKKVRRSSLHRNESTRQTRPCWPYVVSLPFRGLPFHTTTKFDASMLRFFEDVQCLLFAGWAAITCSQTSTISGLRTQGHRGVDIQTSIAFADSARERVHAYFFPPVVRGVWVSVRWAWCLAFCGTGAFSAQTSRPYMGGGGRGRGVDLFVWGWVLKKQYDNCIL